MTKHIFVGGLSRSGTTLMATILDSHRDVSMGYEMLPADLPDTAASICYLESALQTTGNHGKACGRRLIDEGQAPLGTFVKRCARALVPPAELLEILRQFQARGCDQLRDFEMRAKLSMAVVEQKRVKEGSACCGFKLNAPSAGEMDALFPESFFVLMVRDVRDVAASQLKRGFDRTVEQIAKAWQNYARAYQEFAEKHPDRGLLLRYEDLVTRPEETVRNVLDRAGFAFDPQALDFYKSNASIHDHGHANAETLRQNFFATSIGRWVRELDDDQVGQIEKAGGNVIEKLGYPQASNQAAVSLGQGHFGPIRKRCERRKIFYRDQYADILAPYRSGYANLTLAETFAGEQAAGEKILVIRHDIDHDLETAVKMARWEHERGFRATYCVLHTAEYYGRQKGRRFERSREMIDAMLEIQGLGHEVNLHNNMLVVALKEGGDVAMRLERELTFLRRHGIHICGTATHGDALCRELDFRNFELFADRAWDARGGIRTAEYEGRRVEIGTLPMERFGLVYEAYDMPRDVYITDAGGNLRVRHNTRGQGGLRRKDMPGRWPYPYIAGVLTHPIWWNFDCDAPADAKLPDLAA